MLKDLLEKRGRAVAAMRSILDKAATEKRELTTEEQTEYDKHFAEQNSLKVSIDREERQAGLDREMIEARTRAEQAAPGAATETGAPKTDGTRKSLRGTDEYRHAFSRLLTHGLRDLTSDEVRALSVGSDTGGGYTVAAEQFVSDLIKNVDNQTFIRQRATKIPVPTAISLGVPTLDADPDDADWTSELATGSEDSSMAFGRRKMTPHPMAKRIKVSNDFLRQTLTGGEALVRDRLAYKFGITQEKGFMTGTGVQQALGIFTASADGIPTTRDVSSGNTTTAPTFDGLLTAKYTLKGQYWNAASWIFHRDVLLAISKLKDGNGQYLWRESVRVGEPDRVLNFAIDMSEYAPNTLTTGLYVGALGDWSKYWIADAYDVAIKRLDELYAETNQVGFIGRASVDGQFVLPEAAVRVKLA